MYGETTRVRHQQDQHHSPHQSLPLEWSIKQLHIHLRLLHVHIGSGTSIAFFSTTHRTTRLLQPHSFVNHASGPNVCDLRPNSRSPPIPTHVLDVEHAITAKMNGYPPFASANGSTVPPQPRTSFDSGKNGFRMQERSAMPMPVAGQPRAMEQGFGGMGMPRSPPKNKSE